MLYQEEEDSTVFHAGRIFNVNKLLRSAQHIPVLQVDVNRFKGIVKPDELDPERVQRADYTKPIIYCDDPEWGWVPLDGAHRIAKAMLEGVNKIPAKKFPYQWLTKIEKES